jgi:NTE family protein
MENINKQQFREFKNKEFSLVLSGGGALGYYYLGVFKYLEENNVYPKEIIGTSVGSVLGALWALGHSAEEILEVAELSFNECGKSSEKFSKKFRSHYKIFLNNRSFDNLKISFIAIATDIETAEVKIFDKYSGISLENAVFAAASLPGKYKSVEFEGEHFTDGYFVSNFPVEFASCKNILGIDVLSNIELGKFKQSKSLLFSKKQEMFNITFRGIFKLIQKESIRKAKEYNCVYIDPIGKTSQIFNYTQIREKYNLGYSDMKKYFD